MLTVVHHSIWRYLQLACGSSYRLHKLDIIVLIFLFAYTFVDLRHIAFIVAIKRNTLQCVSLLNCLQLFKRRILLLIFGHRALSVKISQIIFLLLDLFVVAHHGCSFDGKLVDVLWVISTRLKSIQFDAALIFNAFDWYFHGDLAEFAMIIILRNLWQIKAMKTRRVKT